MRIAEIEQRDAEKLAVDGIKQKAQQMQQQAKSAQARLKLKTAQQQLAAATKPVTPSSP